MKAPLRGFFLLALLTLLSSHPVLAQAPSSAQQKLLARRAAELDAYRKLAERIKGLQITSQTTVRDFVTESDLIQTHFSTFIKGLRMVGTPVYHPDGSCEVTVAVTLRQVIEELKRIVRRHYVGNRWHDHTFDKVIIHTRDKVLTATGSGAPRPVGPEPVPQPEPLPERSPALPPKPTDEYRPAPTNGLPGWAGVRGDGRLLALRAARADAYRKLLERIRGIRLDSRTTVRDFVTESDLIHAALQTFVKGLRTVGSPRYIEDGSVEVSVAVTLAQVIEEVKRLVKRHYIGNRYHDHLFTKVSTYTQTKVFTALGSGTFPQRAVAPNLSFPGWKTANPRLKLMARRAATADGFRQLVERIKGLSLTSNTTVADFVTQQDLIDITGSASMRGMVESGNTIYYDDGTVALRHQVKIEKLIQEIRRRVVRHGNPVHNDVFQKVRLYQASKVIEVIGEGAADPNSYRPAATPAAKMPPWAGRTITVTGSGATPENVEDPVQAKLLAARAAEVDAYRQLAEQVGGLQLDSRTTVENFILKNDRVRAAVQSYIQSAKIVATRHLPDGTAEVDISLEAGGIVRLLGGANSQR